MRVTAKEYLSQIKEHDRSLKKKLERLERLKSKATNSTVSLGSEGGSGIRKKDSLEDAIIDYMEFEQEIEKEMDQLGQLKLKISEELDTLLDSREATILFHRYIELLEWNEVSHKVGWSIRTCHLLNNKGLENFKSFR